MPIRDTEEINYNLPGGGISDTPIKKPKENITYEKTKDLYDEAIEVLGDIAQAGAETGKAMGEMGLTALHQLNRPYSGVTEGMRETVESAKEAYNEPSATSVAKAVTAPLWGMAKGAIENKTGLSDVHKELVEGRKMNEPLPKWFGDMSGKTKDEQMAVLKANKPLDIPTPPKADIFSALTTEEGAEAIAPLTEGIGMAVDPLMYGANIGGKTAKGTSLESVGKESATLTKQFASGERNVINAPIVQPVLDAMVNKPSQEVFNLIKEGADYVKASNPELYRKVTAIPNEVRRIVFNRTGDEQLDEAIENLRIYNDNKEQMIAVKAYEMTKDITDPINTIMRTQHYVQDMPMQFKLRRGGDKSMEGAFFTLQNDVSRTRPYNFAYNAAFYGGDVNPIRNMKPEIERAVQNISDPVFKIYNKPYNNALNEWKDISSQDMNSDEFVSTILHYLRDEDSFLYKFFASRDTTERVNKPLDKVLNKTIPPTVKGDERKAILEYARDEAWMNLNARDPITLSKYGDDLVSNVAEYNERQMRKAENISKRLFPDDPNASLQSAQRIYKPLDLNTLSPESVEYMKNLTPQKLVTDALESIADSDRYDVIDSTLARLSKHKEAKMISGDTPLSEGYERVYNPFGESFFSLPTQKANQINKIIGTYSTPPKTEAMQMLDGFNKWMKQSMLTGVLIPRPGFVFRNIISEALKGTQAGTGLTDWWEAYNMLSDFKRTLTPGKASGSRPSKLMKEAIEAGVVDTGFIGKEVSEAGSEIFRPKISYIPITDDTLAWMEKNGEKINADSFNIVDDVEKIYAESKQLPTEDMFGIKSPDGKLKGILKYAMSPILDPGNPLGIRTLAQETENIARLGTYIRYRKAGYDTSSAAKMVNKFSFNYGDVSEEMTMLKRLYPFLTFYAKNIPLQLGQYFENPRVQRLLGNLANSGAQTVDLSDMADYEKERIPIKIPGTNKVIYAEDLLSTQDVGLLEDMYNVASGKKTMTDVGSKILMSGLHPIKSIFEVMLGTKVPGTSLTGSGGGFSTFTNQPIEKFSGEGSDFVPGISKKSEHVLKSLVPIVGQAEDWYNAMSKKGRYKDEKYADENKSVTGSAVADKALRELGVKIAKPTEDAEIKKIENLGRELYRLENLVDQYYANDEDGKAEEVEALMDKIIDKMTGEDDEEYNKVKNNDGKLDTEQKMLYNDKRDYFEEIIEPMKEERVEVTPPKVDYYNMIMEDDMPNETGMIMDDKYLEGNTQGYTADDIQKVVDKFDSWLSNYTVEGKPFSAWIVDLAAEYNINPLYLLALIQKEQSAVETSKIPDERIMKKIVGYGYTESGKVKDAPNTFEKQIKAAAKQLRKYDTRSPIKNKTTVDLYDSDPEGRTRLTPSNTAEAKSLLYNPRWEGLRNQTAILKRYAGIIGR